MPSSDVTLLAAYARLEPFGTHRDDWHHARTQSVIVNSINHALYAFGRTSKPKPVSPSEFMHTRTTTTRDKARAFSRALDTLVKA